MVQTGWLGVFACIVCSYEIINMIYGTPGVGGVFAWIVCSDYQFVLWHI
jgi:hypothetical protein